MENFAELMQRLLEIQSGGHLSLRVGMWLDEKWSHKFSLAARFTAPADSWAWPRIFGVDAETYDERKESSGCYLAGTERNGALS